MKGKSDSALATSKDVSRYTSVIGQQLDNVSANMMHCITGIGCVFLTWVILIGKWKWRKTYMNTYCSKCYSNVSIWKKGIMTFGQFRRKSTFPLVPNHNTLFSILIRYCSTYYSTFPYMSYAISTFRSI